MLEEECLAKGDKVGECPVEKEGLIGGGVLMSGYVQQVSVKSPLTAGILPTNGIAKIDATRKKLVKCIICLVLAAPPVPSAPI